MYMQICLSICLSFCFYIYLFVALFDWYACCDPFGRIHRSSSKTGCMQATPPCGSSITSTTQPLQRCSTKAPHQRQTPPASFGARGKRLPKAA